MRFRVHVLGTNSALPSHGRYPSAQVVEHNDRLLLVDCGEGTQFRFAAQRLRPKRLDAVFISHLHGDHLYGLPGFLSSLHIQGRTAGLDIIGPPELEGYLQHCFDLSATRLNYPLRFTSTQGAAPAVPLWRNKALAVYPLPLRHRIPTTGFLFREHPHRPPFLPENAQALQVPRQYYKLLKSGNAVKLPDGRTIQPEEVLGEPEAALAFAYCSDTAFQPALRNLLQGVDLLYHEATFLHELKARAEETLHSTAQEAAEIARQAGVKRLLLGHYSARYENLEPLREEAAAVFPAVELAIEGSTYPVGDE